MTDSPTPQDPVGTDQVLPADRTEEQARMARELAASGYSEAEIAQALTADELTVQRLLEGRD
ncbi:hypothetical protein [Streptomyces acidiscabies]|uniref:hypothetical protein n=1 Tax=Streptomyces acidiscabies TaxID=42234 RepID=UPI0038F7823B